MSLSISETQALPVHKDLLPLGVSARCHWQACLLPDLLWNELEFDRMPPWSEEQAEAVRDCSGIYLSPTSGTEGKPESQSFQLNILKQVWVLGGPGYQ